MTFSWRRVNAIFQKDYKDFSRNMAVSITIFFPIVLAALYSRMGVDSIHAYFLLINMTFAMVTTFVQTCLIAEEKEKNTLRGLMLSPASTLEILAGKSILSFILTIGVVFFTILFSDYRPQNIALFTVAIILSALFYIWLGTILGLFAKSVMEASVLVLPVMVIFSFGTFLINFADDYPILKVAKYLPNSQLVELAQALELGSGFGDVLMNFVVITGWIVIAFVSMTILYRRRTFD